jgi:hypothetical protein
MAIPRENHGEFFTNLSQIAAPSLSKFQAKTFLGKALRGRVADGGSGQIAGKLGRAASIPRCACGMHHVSGAGRENRTLMVFGDFSSGITCKQVSLR